MPTKTVKVGTALSFLVLSGGILYTHATGRLFPGLSAGVLLSAAVLLLAFSYDHHTKSGSSLRHYLWPVVLLSVVYRSYIFLFPATLVGVDPISYAAQVGRVMRTGTAGAITFNFYSDVSFSITLPAMFGLMSDLSAPEALVIYPLLMGVLTPLVVADLTLRAGSRDLVWKAFIAALLGAVATVLTRFSYWPIAQTLGMAFWMLFLVTTVKYYEIRSKRTFLLIMLIFIGMTFAHKLPLLIVFAALSALVLVTATVRVLERRGGTETIKRPQGVIIGMLAGTLMLTQWAYLTRFIRSVLLKAVGVLTTDKISISPPTSLSPPAAAAAPAGGLLSILSRRSYGLVLIPLGGLAFLYLSSRSRERKRPTIKVLLIATVMPLMLLGLGIVARHPASPVPPPSPNRFVSFLEPVLIPLIAVVFVKGVRAGPSSARWLSRVTTVISVLLIGVVLVSQIYAAPAVPDYSDSPRYYLTAQETEAKSFGYQHVDGQIHTDWFTIVSGPPAARLSPDSSEQYTAMTPSLINATVLQQEYEYVLYRSSVKYYATTTGPWKLLWSPERAFDAKYNRIYTTGESMLYKNPDETNKTVAGPDVPTSRRGGT